MNSVDYYTNDGKDAETEISNEAMIEQAKPSQILSQQDFVKTMH